jgi:hypothetical protein
MRERYLLILLFIIIAFNNLSHCTMLKHVFYRVSAITLAYAFLGSAAYTRAPACKPKSGSHDGPSAAAWQQLNDSVSGRLVAPTPPGAVCHPSMVEYNNASCDIVKSQWSNTSYHALNLVSADYNDDACLPHCMYPCNVDSYPRFALPAENAQDVQQAVSFARETGVRLIVKGTGHDVPGR